MAKMEFDVETSVEPSVVLDALTNFTERRPDIWPGLAREFYEVYSVGENTADIKEGTAMPGLKVWAREKYEWTNDKVRWTVQESNFSVPGSYVEAQLNPREGGGTRIHLVWEREGSTTKGRFLVKMLVFVKGKPIAKSVRQAMAKLES